MGKSKQSFFQEKWISYTGLLAVIGGLVGFGYYCGDYKASVTCEKEQLKLIQECNEKLNSEDELCKTATIIGLKRDISDLKKVTNYLNSTNDGQK